MLSNAPVTATLSNGRASPAAASLSNGASNEGSSTGKDDDSVAGDLQENGVLQAGNASKDTNGELEDKVNGEERKRSSRVNQCASFIPNEPPNDELESESEKIGRKYSYVSSDFFF